MNSLDSPGYSHDYLSQDLVLEKEAQKVKILNDIAALIDRGGVEDESDRGIVDGAIAFIKNPTEELSIIISKTTILGQVLGGYLMQGADIPPEIDAIHGYFLGLQCISKIKLVEVELLKGDPDPVKIQGAMARGLDWAKTLSKGYNDNTFLDAFNELQDNIGKL